MKKIIIIFLILSVVVILLGIGITSLFTINNSKVESTTTLENTSIPEIVEETDNINTFILTS